MRRIYQLGGALGVTAKAKHDIDLSAFETIALGVYLPNGKAAELRKMVINFYQPNITDQQDVGAHRADTVTLIFQDEHREESAFTISGTYFWKFIDTVPESFCKNSAIERREYINESLATVMGIARRVYQLCFIDTTEQNSSAPPLRYHLALRSGQVTVDDVLPLSAVEKTQLTQFVGQATKTFLLTHVASVFVDDLLAAGYLKHGFTSAGKYMRPTFTPLAWTPEQRHSLEEMLSELSPHAASNCPAYLPWRQWLSHQLSQAVKAHLWAYYTPEKMATLAQAPVMKKLHHNGGDIFDNLVTQTYLEQLTKSALTAISNHLS